MIIRDGERREVGSVTKLWRTGRKVIDPTIHFINVEWNVRLLLSAKISLAQWELVLDLPEDRKASLYPRRLCVVCGYSDDEITEY